MSIRYLYQDLVEAGHISKPIEMINQWFVISCIALFVYTNENDPLMVLLLVLLTCFLSSFGRLLDALGFPLLLRWILTNSPLILLAIHVYNKKQFNEIDTDNIGLYFSVIAAIIISIIRIKSQRKKIKGDDLISQIYLGESGIKFGLNRIIVSVLNVTLEEIIFRSVVLYYSSTIVQALILSFLLFSLHHSTLPWFLRKSTYRDFLTFLVWTIVLMGHYYYFESLLSIVLIHLSFNAPLYYFTIRSILMRRRNANAVPKY